MSHTGKGLALGLSLIGTGLFGYAIKPIAAWLIGEFGWRGAYVAIGTSIAGPANGLYASFTWEENPV